MPTADVKHNSDWQLAHPWIPIFRWANLKLSNARLGDMPVISYAATHEYHPWSDRLDPLDASVHLNTSADDHLPGDAENPLTTWKTLNRLRTQVGRSILNMLKWGFSNDPDTCDRHAMQHLLVCPMMDTACFPQDPTTANDIAIGCARHWERTIWLTYDSCWRDNNDDERPLVCIGC